MMKRIFLIIIYLFISAIVSAQQDRIGISFFQNYSTFRFVNSEGEKDDMSYTLKSGYGLSYIKNLSQPLFLEGGLSYINKGASSSLDLTMLDWSFHYINADLSLGFMIRFGRLLPQLKAGFYYGRLFKADQFIGSSYYNLMDLNTINKNDLGIGISGGIEYAYSKAGSLLFKLNESIGLIQLENRDSGQDMYNRTFSVQLGLCFTINKDQP